MDEDVKEAIKVIASSLLEKNTYGMMMPETLERLKQLADWKG